MRGDKSLNLGTMWGVTPLNTPGAWHWNERGTPWLSSIRIKTQSLYGSRWPKSRSIFAQSSIGIAVFTGLSGPDCWGIGILQHWLVITVARATGSPEVFSCSTSQCGGRDGAGRREGGGGRCQASSYFKACTWTKEGHVFLAQIYKCLLPSTQDRWWEEVDGSFSYILSLLFKSLEVTRPRMQGVLKYGNHLFIMQMVGSISSIRPSRWSIRDLEFFSRQFFKQAWFLACKLCQYFRDTQLFCSWVVNSGVYLPLQMKAGQHKAKEEA